MEISLGVIIYCVFLGYYVCFTQRYIRIYENIVVCIEENTNNFRDGAAAWRWRGGLERNLGLINRALDSWMNAWHLRPHDFVLNNNIAALLAQQGRYEEAQKFLKIASESPIPTPELKAKWDERMKQFHAVLETSKAKRDAMNKQSRNSPCKCGSGKKFKHCCGK